MKDQIQQSGTIGGHWKGQITALISKSAAIAKASLTLYAFHHGSAPGPHSRQQTSLPSRKKLYHWLFLCPQPPGFTGRIGGGERLDLLGHFCLSFETKTN